MRREGFAEHLEHFEVLADRELMVGFPAVARLRLRDPETLAGSTPPYDTDLTKGMLKAASHLLASGTGAIYAFAERDELSALVVPEAEGASPDDAQDARELLVRLVAEASAKLSLLVGVAAAFDGRLYEFPNPQLALEYFRWRQEQARRRALDRYCSFVLKKTGTYGADTIKVLEGMGEDEKIEILRNSEIDFEGLPCWQRLGAGVYVKRKNGTPDGPSLVVDPNLPTAEAYTEYLRRFFHAH
jgi:tRNA(His) 5'-end guanylyltransferase